MVTVTFYEKSGCINNTRQKKLLACRVGSAVLPTNIVATFYGGQKNLSTLRCWQPDRLLLIHHWHHNRCWIVIKGVVNAIDRTRNNAEIQEQIEH
jgi:hypothetical protein